MNKLRFLLSVALFCIIGSATAQPLKWDKKKYPDLPDPNPAKVDMKAHKKMVERIQAHKIATGQERPDHVNNGLAPAFPPIINQSGGSCGAASSIWYQFTNQINSARFVAADSEERMYPTHYSWLMAGSGVGYPEQGQKAGIPNVQTYGGRTYSNLFGPQDIGDDNCGWMQGYDKWFEAMHNRIDHENTFALSVETEEGREVVKNYLWNRCGDDSYASGGICGVGLAAYGEWAKIPKSDVNDALDVTGMYYVAEWGDSYNHAMTIVGYDDRIVFDLDSNGVVGEKDKDEIGAWIMVNSWGNWCNGGFIYCPYAKANHVKGWTDYFRPGFYDVMRDYRPLRTLRVKMEYDHRSEISLHIGVAQDTTATKPDKETALMQFNYSGDGDSGKKNPAPAVPMLGKWVDGFHYEPMEFGYDLTSLTDGFDLTRPLKYFFWVETRSWGVGEGKLYEVSVIDYTFDRNGVEVPFNIPQAIAIQSAGTTTEVSAVVSGEAVPEPRNLEIHDNQLCWQAPVGSRYEPSTYTIYKDGEKLKSVDAPTLATALDGFGCYSVSASYHVNGYDMESKQSSPILSAEEAAPADTINDVASIKNGCKFTIPNICTAAMKDFTLEFWIFPRISPKADSYGIKANKTNFFFKVNKSGQIEIGHDGGDYTRSTTLLRPGSFKHIAIVNEGLNMKVYMNGRRIIDWSSGFGHQGFESPTDLVFGVTEGTTQNYKEVYDAGWYAFLDEIRFWNYPRTEEEIKLSLSSEIGCPKLYEGLSRYYRMNTRTDGDDLYLVDSKGQGDALVEGSENFTFIYPAFGMVQNPLSTETFANFSADTITVVGKPVAVKDLSSIGTTQWEWDFTGAEPQALTGTRDPIVVFKEAGKQTIRLKAKNLYGTVSEKVTEVVVSEPVVPTVDFIVPEGEIPAGEHISFINTSTPIDASDYEWNIEGAENPVVKTVNAGASFPTFGTYKITLTAHNSAGSKSVTKTITVKKVKPEAAFRIQNNVVLKGEKAFLVDQSKYNPESWTWDVSNGLEIFRIPGQHNSITLDTPGFYDVRLTARNDIGQSSVSRSKAIIVCNADGENGLHFGNGDDHVLTSTPFGTESFKDFTIEWWMYPGQITENSFHMGDKSSTMQLCVKPSGAIYLEVANRNGASTDGTVVFDEWHHYAICYRSGVATFYRDGIKINTARLGVKVPVLEQFTIGGPEAPFNGIIDELRIWNYSILEKDLLAIANEPVSNPEDNEALLLYYDFNQTSGDVIDRSANGLTGVRKNFGPDGDAWESSFGIFNLNPNGNVNDVTATYLKNYKHPFKTGTGTVNPANSSRYLKLLMNVPTSPWKQVNNIKKGSILTEWHVDTEKNKYLTLETTWSDFEPEVKDLMIYQTIELPAGIYQFAADRDGDTQGYNWYPEGTYIVASKGDILSTTAELESDALAYANIDDHTIKFELEEPTQVSLGLLSNMSGQLCLAVGQFLLYQQVITNLEGNGDQPDAINDLTVNAEQTLLAGGGLGCINIRVAKPQHVVVCDLAGKVIFREWLETDARIPAKRGIYIVNRQKVMVR